MHSVLSVTPASRVVFYRAGHAVDDALDSFSAEQQFAICCLPAIGQEHILQLHPEGNHTCIWVICICRDDAASRLPSLSLETTNTRAKINFSQKSSSFVSIVEYVL